MKGSIIRRGGKWAVILDVKDERGARKRKWFSGYRTKKEAEAAAAKLITSMSDGTFVAPAKLTVSQLLHDRLAQWEASNRISRKTAARYRELAVGQIEPHLGAKLVQRLTTRDLEQWHATLRTAGRVDGTSGVADGTIRQAHAVLSSALREAQRHDLVMRNVAELERPRRSAPREEIQILGEAQIDELLARMKGRPLFTKVVVSLFCGIRRGELCALQWRDVDFDGKELRIERALEQVGTVVKIKEPKSTAGKRAISLPDIVIDALRDHRREQLELRMQLGLGRLADNAFVFSHIEDGRPHTPRGISNQWRTMALAIGMPDITWHSFRHSHASMLIASGLDVVSVSKRLGHASPNITLAVYSHLYKREDKAADLINAALANRVR